ncbi:hypothetical protein HQ535_01420 [bacterium]|nr:hypothetical protein [bacterium]
MDAPRDDLIRMFRPQMEEIRADEDGNGIGTLYGHFAVFGQETVIDSWWEGKANRPRYPIRSRTVARISASRASAVSVSSAARAR